jgi:hypothetical protein
VAAGLECTFYNKVQKKGPKGSRAKVLSEIRETQKLISPRPPASSPSAADYQEPSRSQSPLLFNRTPGLLTSPVILACVQFYLGNLYDTQPIHQPSTFERLIANREQSTEAYCHLAAFCSYVFLQSRATQRQVLESHDTVPVYNLGESILEECKAALACTAQANLVGLRVRRSLDWQENPSLSTVYTSFFLFRCQHTLDRKDSAWIHLRQAMTIALIIGLNKEDGYHAGDLLEAAVRRKLFWTLFIAERCVSWDTCSKLTLPRVYALKLHRPLSLYATIQLPEAVEGTYRAKQLFTFSHLIKLYALLDDKFFSLWNGTTTEGVGPGWLEQLQRNFTNSLPAYLDQSSTATVDLIVSQQWLRTLVWRQSMLQGSSPMVSSSTLGSKFISDVCHELVDQLNSFPPGAIDAQGLDLAEKLFDITCCLVDCISALPYALAFEARQRLHRLAAIMSSLSSAQARLLPLLYAKIQSHSELSSDPAFPSASQQGILPMMGEHQTDPTALGLHMMGLQGSSQHINLGISGPAASSRYMTGIIETLPSSPYVSGSADMSARPSTSGNPGFPPYRYIP